MTPENISHTSSPYSTSKNHMLSSLTNGMGKKWHPTVTSHFLDSVQEYMFIHLLAIFISLMKTNTFISSANFLFGLSFPDQYVRGFMFLIWASFCYVVNIFSNCYLPMILFCILLWNSLDTDLSVHVNGLWDAYSHPSVSAGYWVRNSLQYQNPGAQGPSLKDLASAYKLHTTSL